jgi:hypothetical protein
MMSHASASSKPPLDQARVTALWITATGNVRRLRGGLEIAASAEGTIAGAGNDAHPLIRIRGKVVERGLQLEVHRLVQRIHDLWPVQGYRGDVIARVDLDELKLH